MIEINLLPGARKTKRAGSPGMNVGAAFSGALAQVKDGFLLFGLIGLVAGALVTGYFYMRLGARQSELTERERIALTDSTRYAGVLAQRASAEAQRDSVVRQLSIIRAIDGERFTWPHMLDEISEALPAFTWLVSVAQTSPVVSIVTRDSASGAAAQRIEDQANAALANAPRMTVRIIGQTVDIQALTRYMRTLEQSPFIEGVTLAGSVVKAEQGRDVTEFTLDLQFQQPDPSAIRTVPLTVAVR
jgi:Tfp pilus assembly protein PilN